MRQFITILALLTALSLMGCTYAKMIGGTEPTDLTQVQAGATEEKIEDALGAPIATRTVDDKTIDVYRYTIGVEGVDMSARAVMAMLYYAGFHVMRKAAIDTGRLADSFCFRCNSDILTLMRAIERGHAVR